MFLKCEKDFEPVGSMITLFHGSQFKWNAVLFVAKSSGKKVKKLQQGCPTRWSSLFYSLQTAIEAWPFIQEAMKQDGKFFS